MVKLGTKVIGVSGAMFPEREGEIISWENNEIVGELFTVQWEDGSSEPFFKHQFQPNSKRNGIGVYYIEEASEVEAAEEIKINEMVIEKKAFAVRGLNETEYAEIKAAAKAELPFRVAIRQWKRNYAYGQIDIRPYGKGVYRWEKEQFEKVLEFVERHNLLFNASRIKKDNWYLCYNNGFTFMGILA